MRLRGRLRGIDYCHKFYMEDIKNEILGSKAYINIDIGDGNDDDARGGKDKVSACGTHWLL